MVSSLVTYLQQNEQSVGEDWRRYPVIAVAVTLLEAYRCETAVLGSTVSERPEEKSW